MSQVEIDFNAAPRGAEPQKPERRIVVFDLETRLSADEVGGWNNKHLMRVAVGVAWDSADSQFKVFYEEDVAALITLLKSADLVVGFNSRNFDYGVLKGYSTEKLDQTLPTFDILEELEKILKHRVKLDSVAQATLGLGKSGDGLQSLRWVKEGKMDLVRDYCIQDVQVTLDVFRHAIDKKFLMYSDRQGKPLKVVTDWNLEKFFKKS